MQHNSIETGPAMSPFKGQSGSSTKKSFSWRSLVIGSVVGTILGILFWKAVVYWRRLIRQPFLTVVLMSGELENQTTVEAKAMVIAAANLRARLEKRFLPDGQEKLTLCAGLRNFREPWARDLSFASFGLVELNELQAARDTLDVFFLYQRPSGQFPVKVHSTNIVDRYLHSYFKREQPIFMPLRPKYITAHNTISLDGNALLIIAALNYARRAQDEDFVQQHWTHLKRAALWLEQYASPEDRLLHQLPDWADRIARQGRVLYTNVLYWKALEDLAAVAPRYGTEEDARYFEAKVQRVKVSMNEHFWREDLGYYVTSQYFDNLSSSGNLMAIAWGLTTPAQAHAILDNMERFNMANPTPTQVLHRAYPNKFIALENRLGGIGYYHTYAAWLWLGAWHVIALARMGRLKEAETLLYRISNVIVRDGVVHESYTPDGQYISTRWYTSEAPFSWSAGMVVYAYHVYQRQLQKNGTIL